ncbi:PAS domain-containing sensor histidine kinase [Archangium sp.]|uniref:sensor histidine kinase n=1 Tax=Archangium sp. TaxID=1872627 RepID=UPI00286CC810|nr:PAS domain-containing sensor histidine kinase [Archangium sp.]
MLPSRALPLSSALAFVLPALATLLLGGLPGQERWVHEPIHSSLETAGGLIALAVAAVLLWRRHYQGQAPHLLWVVTSLVCMGLQDLAHAWVHVSPGFFWSRALPTLLGGLLIALVWLPARWAQHRAAQRLPLVVGVLTVLMGVAFVALPRAWPNAFSEDGGYLPWARLINMVGGLGFLTSAAFFLRRYRRAGASEDLVFANHGILFGVAGLLFGVSHLWGSIWWLFHVLRLLAYFVVLHHVVQEYRGLQAAEEAGLVRRLERNEAQIRLVTDALPFLVSFIQPDSRYAYVNRAYMEWFGLGREQVLQHHVLEVIGEAAYTEVRPMLERALSGELVSFERAIPYQHGGKRYVRSSYMPQRNPQGEVEGVVALVADITAEKRAQERAGRLQAVTSAISRALTPEDVARAVIAEAIEGIGAGSGTVYSVEPEGGALRLLYAEGLPAQMVTDHEAVPLKAPQPMASVARSGTPLWLESREELLQRFPAMEQTLKASANHSWAILPLLGSSGPLGALMIGFSHPHPLSEEDRTFLLALSHQVSQAFERANLYLAARAAVRVREDFLSVAGHELRTPLTSLKLQLQLLERSRPTHLSEPRLRAMGRQVERLESLVASLLDVGRLSEGRMSLELGDVELHALTREVLGRLAEVFERAGCEVHLEAPVPVHGRWDAQRLDQVLVNLLTNAAKYGAGRPVHVRVEEAGAFARLTVRDEGIGIAPEALPRLFGRFERAVSDSQYGGLGLGLYISRQLVEAMGGRVCVESRLQEGATFTVELPLQPAPAVEELAPLTAG